MALTRRLVLALVVSLFGVSLLHAQGTPSASASASLSSTTCTGTPGSGTGCVSLNTTGYASAAIQITGTWAATQTFQSSQDGVNWSTINATPINGSSQVTTTTGNGLWAVSVAGIRYLQVLTTAYTSGTAVVTIQTALAGGGSGGGGGGASGSVTINDPNTTSQKAAVNASGQLSITCANCSGSGASAVDNSTFTAGTTSGAPAMGFFQNAITTVTTGNTGALAMDTHRSLFNVIRDAAGNARGVNVTAGNALTVDASATTQPVSGTVTANAGTNLNTSALALETGGNLAKLPLGQGSTTSGQSGPLAQGAVTTNAPSYTTAQTSPLSLDTSGLLRASLKDTPSNTNNLNVNLAASAATVTVSGTVTTTPPSNASTNVTQFGGSAVVTGTGAGGAGIPRVTISNDSSLAANQSVNVAQVNGVTTLTGVGAAGTGTQRVVDVASGTTGSAPPTQASYIGGLQSGATGGLLGGVAVCDTSKVINISTATTTLMVTGVSGRQVHICAFHLFTAAANNVAWIEGTGATCGTGTAGMAGGTTAASGYNFVANQGLAEGSGLGEILTTATTGDSVCLITSAATQLSGHIRYAIF